MRYPLKKFRIKLIHPALIPAVTLSFFLWPAPITRAAATASTRQPMALIRLSPWAAVWRSGWKRQAPPTALAIDAWPSNTQPNQQWTVTRLGDGSYEIIGVQSGQALDVLHQSTTTGANLDIWPYLGQANQRWVLTPTSGGSYTIEGVQSGNFLQARNPGATLAMEQGNGAGNQQWLFQLATTASTVSTVTLTASTVTPTASLVSTVKPTASTVSTVTPTVSVATLTVSAVTPTVSTISAVTPSVSTVSAATPTVSTVSAVTPTVSTVSAVTPTVSVATLTVSAVAPTVSTVKTASSTPGPAPASAASSMLGPVLASITANGTTTQVITVQARDIYRNNETSGGATVVFSLSGTGTISATTDNGNGTYSATLTAPTSVGTGTVTATLNGAAVGAFVNASQCVATYFSANIGDPVPNLTSALSSNFTTGSAAFQEVYYPSTGLGPVYNNNACANCHDFPVAGGGGSNLSTRFGSSTNGVFNPLTSLGGTLLHGAYINANCVETVPVSANVTALRRVRALFGAGLIEAIPDAVIENNATVPNVDKIVGTVALVTDPVDGKTHAGRFGWKGQYASLLAFSADAENNEIGRSNRFEPVGHAPNGNVALYNAYNTLPDPKDVIDSTGKADCDRDSDYVRLLGPAPTVALSASAVAGQALFHQISCDECHTPTLTTSASFIPISDLSSENTTVITALSNKSVPLYSDLLLHNMGTLNDGIAQGAATPNQMMTPPLWGLRYKIPYLHDGRATNSIDAAIRAHAGDALPAATRYINLSTTQQQQLVAFLNSI
jgi:CxxC motif-containing protein (DUF1111 family)